MLAERSQVGVATIKRAEGLDGMVRMTEPNVEAVRRAFHDAGVEFIPENGGGAGVRMRTLG